MLSFALIFQLIFPVFAHSTQSAQTGYYATVCTTQGYQKIWLQGDNNKEQKHYSIVNCSECLLSHYEYEDKAFNTIERYSESDNTLSQVVSTYIQQGSNFVVAVFPIRAPPSIS